MGSTGLTLADLPNIFIMIGALVALFVMLVILLRNMEVIGIMGEGREDAWGRTMQPPRLLMQRVHIPFTFKLRENAPIGYSGVDCCVSSTVRYWHASWWGAPVRELHTTLWGSLGDILASSNLHFTKSSPHDEKPLRLSTDEPLQLGPPPRSCYPLVVILARELRDTGELRPDDTVALVSVVHIRDEQCPLPSGVIAQYLKQANGHLSCLKQLYVSGECGEAEGRCAACAPRARCPARCCPADTPASALRVCRNWTSVRSAAAGSRATSASATRTSRCPTSSRSGFRSTGGSSISSTTTSQLRWSKQRDVHYAATVHVTRRKL